MNAMQLFDLGGRSMRFGILEDGRPWVAAPDFAKGLGYAQAKDALRLLDDEEKGRQIVPTLGGPQEITVIFEDGMWELIFLSRRPEAKVLKKRVKEILREIRTAGRYQAPVEPVMPELDEEEVAKRWLAALQTNKLLVAKVEEQAPKAEAFDKLMSADGTFSMEAAAKIVFGVSAGRTRLFALLYQDKVLAPASRLPYQRYMRYFRVTAHTYARNNGGTGTSYTPAVTPEGLDWLRKRYTTDRGLALVSGAA